MHPEVGMFVNRVADARGKELDPETARPLRGGIPQRRTPLALLSFNETPDHDNGLDHLALPRALARRGA